MPTKLMQFLEHAQANLGVTNALAYEAQMCLKGFGPDILDLVSQDSLVNLGITPGDAIHLQNNAPKWWNGSHAKQKWSGLKANQQIQPCPTSAFALRSTTMMVEYMYFGV